MRVPIARLAFVQLIIAAAARDAIGAPGVSPSPTAPMDPTASPPAAAAPVRDADEFPIVLGSFSTTLVGSNPARTHNIRLALMAVDSTVLEPGAELSFNRAVGPRTEERGYRMAPVILREERQLSLGGGICQLASTMFVAALLAGLTPIERHRHSSPIDYIALGQDATIAWGFKDLKLRNDSDTRVRLRAAIVGSTLTAVVDAESPLPISFDLEIEEREVPPSSDENLPGRELELYRIHRVDGEDVEREFIHRDAYPSARMRARPGGR